MRKGIVIVLLAVAAAAVAAYAAYGQSKEHIDRLKESERHIELLKKVESAIATIEKERKLPSEMKILDVTDLIMEIPDHSAPSPFVSDVESAGYPSPSRIVFGSDEEMLSRACFDPDTLVEILIQRTGADNWQEEPDCFGTIELHRGKLIVVNTPEMVAKVEALITDLRKNVPPLVSSTIHLLVADDEYLEQLREKSSSVINADAIKKVISDSQPAGKVEVLKTGYISAYSSQSAYLYCGTIHTYQGDTDTSGQGGFAPMEIFDPIINLFREGLTIGLRAQYNRQTNQTNLSAMVTLSKLTSIEEHTAIGGGLAEEKESGVTKCKVETPKVDMQVVSGTSDVPPGCGLILGGSKMKTAQTEQKSFVVLIVPSVSKR